MSQRSRRLLVRSVDPFGVPSRFRLIAVLIGLILFVPGPRDVRAQDSDTQRPLPLPANDLPDFSQQLELLRKLQSVIRSREQQTAGEQNPQQREQQTSADQSASGSSTQPDSSNTPKTTADPGQMSQLQNALKNLAGRLPPDFVPPSLDAIPKEDLKKAMENPAIRKSVQDMLRQFAKDGVIPPPAPPGQQDASPSPLPPRDQSEPNRDQPESERSADRPRSNAGNENQNEAGNSSNPSGGTPPDSQTPDSTTPDSQTEMPGSEDRPVPPSSLKSLQDFMNRLASQAPAQDDKGSEANGNSMNSGDSQNPPNSNRRSGPMRRRDPSTNSNRKTPAAPPTDMPDVKQPTKDTSEQPSTDSSGAPEKSSSQGETGAAPMGESQAAGSLDAQRKALEALQAIMKEIEQEENASASSPPNPGDIPGEMNDADNDARAKAFDMLRKFGEQNPGDMPPSSEPRQSGGSQSGRKDAAPNEGTSPLTEMPSVQQFLKQELERMKASPADDQSQNSSARGDRDSQSSPNRVDQPSRDPRLAPSQSGGKQDSSRSNSSTPPVRSQPAGPSPRPGMNSMQPPIRNDRNESAMSPDQPTGRPKSLSGQQAPSNDPSQRMPSSPATERNMQSADNVRKELEQRGVLETLRKTWEKSVQESREQRKQELLQKQMQPETASNAADEKPSDIEDRMSGLDQQLNELAQSIKDNPNAEKAAADMIERIAKDMSEQQRARSAENSGNAPSNSGGSTIAEKLNSEFPGKSMLRSIRDTVSDALSDTSSAAAGPASSSPVGGGMLAGGSGATGSFDFTPILFLAGTLAAIAILFYGLRAVRFRQTPEAALAGVVANIRPSEISTRADIVRAFHEMAIRTARSAQLWWTHRKVQTALTNVAPDKQQAVETLVQTYEQARYLPQEQELSPDQIQSARSALQQLQT